MTKVRAPLSFENGLDRIAGVLGWQRMAEIVDQKERTVRNWGDPDTLQHVPVCAALKLDCAYRAAGGEGEPMFETYAHLLKSHMLDHFAAPIELGRRAAVAIREGAQAHEALIVASFPDATDADWTTAIREVEEAVSGLGGTLALLKRGRSQIPPLAEAPP